MGRPNSLEEFREKLEVLGELMMRKSEDESCQFVVCVRHPDDRRKLAAELGSLAVLHDTSMSGLERDAVLRAFKSGSARYLVGSSRALGVGWRPPRGATLVYWDPEVDDATKLQLTNRIWRESGEPRPTWFEIWRAQ